MTLARLYNILMHLKYFTRLKQITHLETIFSKNLLILFFIFLGNNLAKLREVNKPIFANLIGQVQHLLLQAKHLQGSGQVLKYKYS